MKKLKQFLILIAVSLFCISCSSVAATTYNPWQVLELPTQATFADVAFTDDPNRGWLVGTQATLFETTDGGNSWQEKIIDLQEEKVTFSAVSFYKQEGWITGKPAILLHTSDGGKSWARIPLSSKLPGGPDGIIALGPSTAEMVTDLGAIYKTTDGGKTWKALVEGAVGVARNINRSEDGKYVAVSAKGNFYSIWEPGQTEWTPHQRNSSRRVQNMGFTEDNRVWMLARGGQVQFTKSGDLEDWEDAIAPESSNSWGFLDLGYRTPEEMWVAGGSGTLLVSSDGGATWQKDKELEQIPSNFYKVVFLNSERGFVLGERGVLLKYVGKSEAA